MRFVKPICDSVAYTLFFRKIYLCQVEWGGGTLQANIHPDDALFKVELFFKLFIYF